MALSNEHYLGLFLLCWWFVAYLVGLLNEYFHKKEGYWLRNRLARMSGQTPCDSSETAVKSAMFLSMEE